VPGRTGDLCQSGNTKLLTHVGYDCKTLIISCNTSEDKGKLLFFCSMFHNSCFNEGYFLFILQKSILTSIWGWNRGRWGNKTDYLEQINHCLLFSPTLIKSSRGVVVYAFLLFHYSINFNSTLRFPTDCYLAS